MSAETGRPLLGLKVIFSIKSVVPTEPCKGRRASHARPSALVRHAKMAPISRNCEPFRRRFAERGALLLPSARRGPAGSGGMNADENE